MSTEIQVYQFELCLTIISPFLSHKAGSQSFGYDMSMLKNNQGHPVFLGSLIRGNLRHSLLTFQHALKNEHPDLKQEIQTVLALFGKESSDKKNSPNRANFKFDFHWQIIDADKISINNTPRYRIGIDQQSGTVEQGNLQVIEATFKQGQDVPFSGIITAHLNSKNAKLAEKWLSKAAQFIPAIGALKGTGFGKIKNITLSTSVIPATAVTKAITDMRIGICIKPDRPFCIARPHTPNHNRFTSEEFIPANVIIGCIAQQYPEFSRQDWFDKLIITHALPALEEKPERQSALPLSLASITKNQKRAIVDLALSTPQPDKAIMIIEGAIKQPPSYQSDWKKADKTAAMLACYCLTESTHLNRQLIVRTGIEEGANNAKESALFSLDCICPEQILWCADIDFSFIKDDTEKKQAQQAISKVLANGLQGIGKTKANATLKQRNSFYQSQKIKDLANHYIITLQTPARLFAPPEHIKASGDAASLAECYRQYWHDISKGKLSLSHYYAQQSKVGGHFHWNYFQQGQNYQPEWLTSAGSVFVLQASTQEGLDDMLKEWLTQGLPQAKDKQHSNWENNPYIKQNGFGEIHLNDPIHTSLSVQTQQLKEEWL